MNTKTDPLHCVRSLLTAGREALAGHSESARLDAELLLGHSLSHDRAWLYANPEATVDGRSAELFRRLLGQRAAGQPVAQLTGQREFWSLPLAVNEFTLIPRPETELLVERLLARLPADQTPHVLDLGTGSGAIAIAIATEHRGARIRATDIENGALTVARANALKFCPGRIGFDAGDWFAALTDDCPRFDVIVSNPPYIGTTESALTDPELAFEPVAALYSGRDGLDSIRVIIKGAVDWLLPDGWLLLEHGFTQAGAISELLRDAGYTAIHHYADAAGHLRVTEARLPA